MNSRLLFSTLALAALCALTGCGGGDGAEAPDGSAQASSGGISGSGVVAQSGGISGSGVVAQSGGISGSGVVAQSGGISGSGVVAQSGGISGSGVVAQSGGISGSGVRAQSGGISGSGIMSVAAVQGCSLASVFVTIASVRVNANGAADLGSAGWLDVPLAAPVRVDLLALVAGGALPVDLTSLPDGSYRQMRLLLVADDANTPLADAVVAPTGAETALAVPGAAQGGLPLAVAITVADGQVSASYRDLAVCKSVTNTANTFALGPVSSGATQVASAY